MSKILFLFYVLLILVINGCGGSQSNPVSNNGGFNNISTPKLIKYDFAATIDMINGTTSFPVFIGDTVTGSFSFDPTVKDTYIQQTNLGGYVQKSPAGVQVKVRNKTINADLTNWLGYVITVENNDSTALPTRDIFSWAVNDTNLANTYGLDYIQVVFTLRDFTATVFNNDTFPSDIKLSNFSNNYIFINGSNINAGIWSIRCTNFVFLSRVQ